MPSISQNFLQELTTVQIIVGLVISLIIVSVWNKAFDNFFYGTLGLDKTSSYETFVLASAVTIFFFLFLIFIQTFSKDIVLGVSAEGVKTATFLGGDTRDDQNQNLPCEDNCNCNLNEQTSVRRRKRCRR